MSDPSRLRVLHIGSGFRPFRRGGLVAYIEDLVAEQRRRGDEPVYLFAGRAYPGGGAPRLRRERSGPEGAPMLEIANSPLIDHGHQPELELSEPRVEAIVRRVIAEQSPDVVHVHELAGLPTSVLDVAREPGVPVLYSAQDYFPLCPMFKLVDADGRVCLRREVGADCMATSAADTRDPGLIPNAAVRYDLHRVPGLRRAPWKWRNAVIAPAGTALSAQARERARRARTRNTAGAFQRRRDVNVERLNRLDCVVGMSRRVTEIYGQLGVDESRLRTMQFTLAHIERLTPRAARTGGGPVTFATLGGAESPLKGSRVLMGAARELADEARAGRFRLLVFGYPDDEAAEAARHLPGVELRRPFRAHELDTILDEVDVGIMPSTWEEAYGYAGMEFLAKGIPVIANAVGGMVDYAEEGRTAWLNRSCTAAGLAEVMRGILAQPHQIADLNATLRAERDSIVMPMSRHADEMDGVYRELIAERTQRP